MNDLLAGHIPSLIASAPTATAFMREGRIRALAVTGAKRSPFDPEIPTIAEQGFPGYAATNWYCLVVSSKVPPENVATLTTLMNKALNAPEVQAAYGKHGMETLAGTAAEAADPDRARDRDLEEGHRRRRHPPRLSGRRSKRVEDHHGRRPPLEESRATPWVRVVGTCGVRSDDR